MEIDTGFIERLYQKDEEAIKIFLNEFKIPLYNYIYRMTRSRHDVEDILQEVFLKIFKNIQRIDFSKNYKSFIYKVARNSTLDFLRKRKDEYELNEEVMSGEDISYRKIETKDRIEKALQSIRMEEREIILLKYIQGLKISEISEILEIPENTVKVRIFRAVRKIRKHMQDE